MECLEKRDLQHKCTAAWETFAAEAERQGFLSNQNGGIQYPAISQAVGLSHLGSYAAVARLRGEHLAASRALSLHLTSHRC